MSLWELFLHSFVISSGVGAVLIILSFLRGDS